MLIGMITNMLMARQNAEGMTLCDPILPAMDDFYYDVRYRRNVVFKDVRVRPNCLLLATELGYNNNLIRMKSVVVESVCSVDRRSQ